MREDFEQIVSNNKTLNVLINEQKFGAINGLKLTEVMTPEFIDWISPKYYDSVKTIYDRRTVANEGEICAVLRVIFLANDETKEKISELVMPHIDYVNESFSELYEVLRISKKEHLVAMSKLSDSGYLINAIFQHVNTPSIEIKKAIYAKTLIDSAELLKGTSARHSPIGFKLFEILIGRLQKLGLEGEFGDKLAVHENKLKVKAAWGIVVTVIIILLILVRFMGRL